MSTIAPNIDFQPTEAMPPWLDVKMVSAMRLVLALSALAIIAIDPSEPNRLVGLTYGALIAYSLYSGLIYFLSLRQSPMLPLRNLHWIDLAWYLAFIALSSGTSSIFFFFLFFAILVASFWWGYRSGLRVAIISTLLFTIIGYVTARLEPDFRLNQFLLRALVLLALGYLIAYWGGHEVQLKRRLQFLKDINKFSNPRFGIERTIGWAMARLRDFYEAESCLLVLRKRNCEGYSLRRLDRGAADDLASVVELNEDGTRLLLAPDERQAVIYREGGRSLICDVVTGETIAAHESIKALAHAIDAASFLSVPLHYRSEAIGRLYLIREQAKFSQSDIEFVIQVIGQVVPVLENIHLVDDLASHAAEQERQKIARDIHDGIIQPYIGLNLGLAAISQKLERGDTRVAEDVKNVSELVLKQIADLRDYIGGLNVELHDGTALLPGLRRFASRFSQATGIEVKIEAPEGLRLNNRLATELFHMITEGLSNIRRHTHAHCAEAELFCRNGHLVLQIKNENPDGPANTSFYPRSLAQRAEALGGKLTICSDQDNRTIVNIQIQL